MVGAAADPSPGRRPGEARLSSPSVSEGWLAPGADLADGAPAAAADRRSPRRTRGAPAGRRAGAGRLLGRARRSRQAAEVERRRGGRRARSRRSDQTWAMRGTLHLLVPEDAGAFLSLLAAGRMWERPSWVRGFGLDADQIERLRVVVREALDGAALTREELGAEVAARPGLGHVAEALRSGWGAVLKPLAFQGDLCFGPSQGNRVTFTRPERASRAWRGVPDANEAAPRAIAAYLSAYGPATAAGFGNWLSRGRIARRQLREWFAELGDRLSEVEVDGERAHVLAEDLDSLAAATPPRSPTV
ncbi:MAG: crosslink repair DNA glycosylase YcaQ family protein, partial [Candidatus Dormiibacterota bacterium]